MEPCIIMILWSTISILLFIQNMQACVGLPISSQIIVVIIFMLGGPILALAAILETVLDAILPEGWSGDDDNDFKGY